MPYRPFFIVIALGLVLLFGNSLGLTHFATSRYMDLIEPALAQEAGAVRQTARWFSLLTTIGDISKENTALRQRVVELEAEVSQLQEVRHENEILKQELQFAQSDQLDHLSATLIGRSPTGIIKDLIIDRGSTDGISSGQAVISQGHLVGLVTEVAKKQATVRLLSNPRSLVPVMGQDSRSTGILRGGISGLTVTDLLIDSSIRQDETLITSSLGGELPAGIPIGKVIEVKERKGDITKKATIRSPLDVTKLEIVFIQRGKK